MEIALACDHGGFRLKGEIAAYLREQGVPFTDYGVFSEEAADYPDQALLVAEAVRDGRFARGIIICGTGVGVAIAANKVPGVRAALCHDSFSAKASREHNDANVLTMGQRVIGPGLALEIVEIWLNTAFLGGRHARRVAKLTAIEQKYDPSGG